MTNLKEYKVYVKISGIDEVVPDSLFLSDYEVKSGFFKKYVDDFLLDDALLNVEKIWVTLNDKVIGQRIIKKVAK